MNNQWLSETADIPIQYIFGINEKNIEKLLKNNEVSAWISRLSERAKDGDIGAIHGSHDYRMENILGKCYILGLNKDIPQFADCMTFILRFLNEHVQTEFCSGHSFGRIYHFRDYEKVLGCFLPFLGYQNDPAILHITQKRIEILYNFTLQKRYDIYADTSKLKSVKKEWQPYIIDPNLYSDGHIALPDMHDFLLFAGMYPVLSADEKEKVEIIVDWLFDDGYNNINRRYGYFYITGGSYNTKAIIFKLHLLDFNEEFLDNNELAALIFNVFILSHFKSAKKSKWFTQAIDYLNRYKNENNRYNFPPQMLIEKPDRYVIFGGHMNVGEPKSKLYNEILSTYWMEKIKRNLF